MDSPHRASIRSTSSFPGASGSVSSFHDNLQPSPRGTVAQTNSRGEVIFIFVKVQAPLKDYPTEKSKISKLMC